MLQILNEEGKIVDKTSLPHLTDDDVEKIYKLMVLTKAFDYTALKLQREGRILTYASTRGQEAQVAVAYAARKEDWVVPAFRENGVMITVGMPMELLYMYWAGDERGSKIPEGINALPVTVPVSTQIPHAVGIAWANRLQRKKSIVFTFFGDGATSKGDFHEAMNFAGVFKVPCIFVCQNNQWAISMPRSRQTASETIAQKALAYGFEGIQVDGNDIFAVYKAASDAAEKARQGKGPTLIEMFTYRLSDHTTADDATRYRTQKEIEEWEKKDPIDRVRKYLVAKNLWSAEEEQKLVKACEEEVNEAVKKAESVSPPKADDMFSFTFETLPKNLKEQMEGSKQ